MPLRAWGTVAAVAAISAGGWLLVGRATPSGSVSPGSPAPDFRARALDSAARLRTLGDYRGEVVLLNLWATWCGPCEWEMPGIEALHRAYPGLRVVAVAVDDPGFEDRVRAFVTRHQLTFEVLSEGSGRIERDYQSRGLPATYLIGRDGMIRKRIAGASDWNSAANRALIAQLLGLPIPGDAPSVVPDSGPR